MIGSDAWVQIVNSVTGDRMLVLARGNDDGDDFLEVQFDVPPHSPGTPLHRHGRMTERFDVLDGTLSLCVDRRWHSVTAGDSVTVTAGQAHCYRNDSDAWVTFIAVVQPRMRFERFLRTWTGLANTARANRDGVPRNVLHLARCLQDADFTFAGAPAVLQRAVFACLVWIGTLSGAYASLMDFDLESSTFDAVVAR